jgi:hypothetical protein
MHKGSVPEPTNWSASKLSPKITTHLLNEIVVLSSNVDAHTIFRKLSERSENVVGGVFLYIRRDNSERREAAALEHPQQCVVTIVREAAVDGEVVQVREEE